MASDTLAAKAGFLAGEARLDADAFRENTVYNGDGDAIRLIANAERLEQYAETMDAQASRIEALEAELAKAKVPHWFYHPDYTEVCEFSPWDVIDGRYDPEPGDHVFEIVCARPLPSIWCAVRVTADPDADERFTFTEHSSEAEARAALEGSGND